MYGQDPASQFRGFRLSGILKLGHPSIFFRNGWRGKIGPVYSRPLNIFSGNVSDAMTAGFIGGRICR